MQNKTLLFFHPSTSVTGSQCSTSYIFNIPLIDINRHLGHPFSFLEIGILVAKILAGIRLKWAVLHGIN